MVVHPQLSAHQLLELVEGIDIAVAELQFDVLCVSVELPLGRIQPDVYLALIGLLTMEDFPFPLLIYTLLELEQCVHDHWQFIDQDLGECTCDKTKYGHDCYYWTYAFRNLEQIEDMTPEQILTYCEQQFM